MRLTGVTTVYVIGGPDAISRSLVTELQNTPAYICAGSQRVDAQGQVIDLVVQTIFGQTADDTASAVATFPGPKPPGTAAFHAAYGGQYNDTSGSGGSPIATAPDLAVTTAILATDQSFQDAASASSPAYTSGFPLVLTNQASLSPAAVTALTNLGVQQVIAMGGPIAISDAVLTQVEALGISVLRIAGTDFTDTSQLLAQFELNSVAPPGAPLAGQTNGLDYNPTQVNIARGDYYTDGIVASSASVGIPILLTWNPQTTGNPSGTDYLGKFLTQVGQMTSDPGSPTDGTINNLLIVGGPFAVSGGLESQITKDLNG